MTFSTNEFRRYILYVLSLLRRRRLDGLCLREKHVQARVDLTASVLGSTDATKNLSSNGSWPDSSLSLCWLLYPMIFVVALSIDTFLNLSCVKVS